MKKEELLRKALEISEELKATTWQEIDGIDICAIDRDYIQMAHGIELVAEIAGEEIQVNELVDVSYPIELWFMYGGKKFLELRKER